MTPCGVLFIYFMSIYLQNAVRTHLGQVRFPLLVRRLFFTHFSSPPGEINVGFSSRSGVTAMETDQTELQKAEKELARLSTFPEQNPNPVIETDPFGNVTYVNPAARERFPDLATSGLEHPILQDLESVIGRLGQGEDESHRRELEIAGRIYEQRTVYMAENALVRIYAHDITDLRRAEQALSRLATFPEQNPNPVVETDISGNVTYVNPAARARFADLAASGLEHPILHDLSSIIRTLKVGEEESFSRDLQIEGCIYHQRIVYMAENSLVRLYSHDITELKRLQSQLQENLHKLEQSNRELRETQVQLVQSEKMAAMATLVAGIAHEINTPVGAITSAQDTLDRAIGKLREILANEFSPEKQSGKQIHAALRAIGEVSKVVKTGSERVSSIVASLRNFAHLDEAELKSVDIREGLDDTLRLVQHDLGDRIKVFRNYGDAPPIVCYPARLNQVFLCLLVNAIEAIEDAGRITLSTFKKDDKLHVIVEDDGIGIGENDIDRVFDPGFTTKGVGVGTGLGLSICRRIVEDHKGQIQVESKVAEGAIFTVALPYSFSGFLLGR